MFQKKDVDTLKYLEDITVTYFDNDAGFKIDFHFKENPYFENKVLTKTYKRHTECNDDTCEDIIPEGCEIKWKEGKNLTVKVITKKQRHKSGGKLRTVKKYFFIFKYIYFFNREVECDSFYNFFKPLKAPDVDEEEEEEDALDAFEALVDSDIELGQLIAEKIVPDAINYYLNEPEDDSFAEALQNVTIDASDDDE